MMMYRLRCFCFYWILFLLPILVDAGTFLCQNGTPKRPRDCVVTAERMPSSEFSAYWKLTTFNQTCYPIMERNLSATRYNFGREEFSLLLHERSNLTLSQVFTRNNELPSAFHMRFEFARKTWDFWQKNWYVWPGPLGENNTEMETEDSETHGCQCFLPDGYRDRMTLDFGGGCHCYFSCVVPYQYPTQAGI